ncbi:metal ABC transporter permease [Corynebacterium tapiri]|uniref:Metal ABC transporter permease n=1 Tax=Corynebacterium tapiri TaxID=1448266 RepID=A0A5C4U566_9CORY|nr:metal ABC transporter permease [Corynebacterium tapiri]TNL98485.1 metal ABC transporter permease [Corynebacterium tapiri]
MSFLASALLLAVATGVACAVPGSFMMLRNQSMLVDALGHAVLPGIAVGYLLTRDLSSPALAIGAGASGLLVVWLTHWLDRTGKLSTGAALGLTFPALFAIGVLIISGNLTSVHLDPHVALVGDVNLAVFSSPRYSYVMAVVAVCNIVLVCALARCLAIDTVDPEFARLVGVPQWIPWVLFFDIAVTTTFAFHAAGSLLTLALSIIPAASARLWCSRLSTMLIVTGLVAVFGAAFGFWFALQLGTATSATMTVVYGVVFLASLIGSRVRRG